MKKIVHIILAVFFSAGLALAQGGHGTNHGAPVYGQGHHGGGGQMQGVLSPRELSQTLRQMQYLQLDRDRIRVAKQALRRDRALSRQILQMADLIRMESKKINFLKFAYFKVVDLERFDIVKRTFRFSSSARELDQFIAMQQPVYGGGATCGTGGQGGGGFGVNAGAGYDGFGHGGHGGHVAPPAPSCCTGAPAVHSCGSAFEEIVRIVRKECFDRDKLRMAKLATRNEWLSSKQVLRIMELMTFDDYKLEFAKFAYSRTWDANRFYIVMDGLTFTSSKRELEYFISRGGGSCG